MPHGVAATIVPGMLAQPADAVATIIRSAICLLTVSLRRISCSDIRARARISSMVDAAAPMRELGDTAAGGVAGTRDLKPSLLREIQRRMPG